MLIVLLTIIIMVCFSLKFLEMYPGFLKWEEYEKRRNIEDIVRDILKEETNKINE